MAFALDTATNLTKVQEDLFALPKDESFWNWTSAFGGWLGAATIAALYQHQDYRGEIVSLNVNFISAVDAETIYFRLTIMNRKRTTDFWRVVAYDAADDGKTLFSVDIVASQRRDHPLVYSDPMPDQKPLEESFYVEPNPLWPRWIKHFDTHLGKGVPFTGEKNPNTVAHIKEADGRPLDVLSLVAMLDTPMPRFFFLLDGPGQSSTLSMSTHIYASAEEIAATPPGAHLVLAANCAGISHSLYNQECRLFRPDGLLLATSYQTALFKVAT
ncbi:MAG: thioesterase family protein [Pseudomonadota bacterium]